MIEQLLDPFGIVPDRAGIAIRRVASWDDALARASTEELLLELRRRIIDPRDRRHNTWDDWDGPDPRGDRGGLDPHGDWPEEG